MTASLPLKAFSLLTALAIATAALWPPALAPRPDPYRIMIKLAAGALAAGGSLYLACAVGRTFLAGGGRGAFKALYWASFAVAGAGVAEAASAFMAVNAPLAAALAALAFAGAGLMLLSFSGGH